MDEGGGGKKVQFLLEVTDGMFGIKAMVDDKQVALFASVQESGMDTGTTSHVECPPGREVMPSVIHFESTDRYHGLPSTGVFSHIIIIYHRQHVKINSAFI